jgi:hypothetical protein
MEKPRISNEWLLGATVGGYIILSVVLYFWGYAFIHSWCGNSPVASSTEDGRVPGSLLFVVVALIIGALDWAQMKFAQTFPRSSRFVRAALWMNFVGILSSLAVVATNYGPSAEVGLFVIVLLLGMACWPLGLLFSIGNLIWACVRRLVSLSISPTS